VDFEDLSAILVAVCLDLVLWVLGHRLLESLPRLESLLDGLLSLPFSARDHPLLVVRHTCQSGLFDGVLCISAVFIVELINIIGFVIESFGKHFQVNRILFANLFFVIDLIEFVFHVGDSDKDLTLVHRIHEELKCRLIFASRHIRHQILVESHLIQLLSRLT